MTDPLSIAGSVAGVVSLGIQVTQSLIVFYKSYRYQDSELAGIIGRLESLAETLQHLAKALSGRTFQADERSLVKNIETSVIDCDELIQELQDECQKFSKTSSSGIKAAARVVGRRATYPFRQSTLQKLDEDIGEIRSNLSIALDVLQLNDTQRFREDVVEMKALMESVQTHQISSGLRDWLSAPNAFVDHNAACAKKHPGTGTWLIKDLQFQKWLTGENSVLWLKGFAGSGKSVLCSTAIQFVLRHRGHDRGIGIAFFYFTFNDDSKQDESSMLRALLLQLSSQLKDDDADLKRLHESYKAGMPPSSVLLEYSRRLIQRFHHVYILLDALDESPRSGPRGCVLDTLETMRQWGMGHLHLFVTSRDEPDIHESLNLPTIQQVTMSNAGIDRDIVDFILGRLSGDRRLRRLSPYQDKIQRTLAQGARGV